MSYSIINFIKQAKERKFDNTLWCNDNPGLRYQYSYKLIDDWKVKNEGVIFYPCCPFCGIRVGPDDKQFISGAFCDYTCKIAWHLHYRYRKEYKEYVKNLGKYIHDEIASRKINMYGDGI